MSVDPFAGLTTFTQPKEQPQPGQPQPNKADPFAGITTNPQQQPNPQQQTSPTPSSPVPTKLPKQPLSPLAKASTGQLVGAYARKYGVPEQLALAIANQESGLDNSAVSQAGAVGVMQIVPKYHPDVKDPTDIHQNIDAGMKYLSSLYRKFGNWTQAVAAYNAGPARIPQNTWAKIPETRNYVDSILGKGTTDKFVGAQQPLQQGRISLPQPAQPNIQGFQVPLMSATPQQQRAITAPQPQAPVPQQQMPVPPPQPQMQLPLQAPPAMPQPIQKPQPQMQLPLQAPPTRPQPTQIPQPAPPPGPGAASILSAKLNPDAAKNVSVAPPVIKSQVTAEVNKPPHKSIADKISDFLIPEAQAQPQQPVAGADPFAGLGAGEPSPKVNQNNIKTHRPQNALEWAQVLVNSGGSGFLSGATGIPIGVGAVGIDAKYLASLDPETRKAYIDANGGPHAYDLPVSMPLWWVGNAAGMAFGTLEGQRGATTLGQLATKVPVLRAIPAIEGIASNIVKRVPLVGRKAESAVKAGYQTIRLITPMATGFGGLQALRESIKEIYDNGYIDPRHVGQEFVNNAVSVYLLGGAAAALPPLVGGTVSLLPKVAGFIGGPDVEAAVREFRPGQAIPQAYRAVARGLQQVPSIGQIDIATRVKPALAITQRLANTKIAPKFWQAATQRLQDELKGAPKGIWERATAINNLGYTMDQIANELSWGTQFPTYATRLDGPYPTGKKAIFSPQDVWGALDRPRTREIHTPEVRADRPSGLPGKVIKEATYKNTGGGVFGEEFHKEIGGQLRGLEVSLRQAFGGTKLAKFADDAGLASRVLRQRAGLLDPKGAKFIADKITKVLDAPIFKTDIPTHVGATGKTIMTKEYNEEGRFLEHIRDIFQEMAIKPQGFSKAIPAIRSGIAHTLLGMGNIMSGLTVFNRISFPLATEGLENTTRAMNEMRVGSPLYKRFVWELGLDEPHLHLTGEPGVPSKVAEKISEASFASYNAMEKRVLPSIGISRYFTSINKGMKEADAIREGLSYARSLRTNTSYDVPDFLRNQQGIMQAARLTFQFFPFAFKSLTEMGGMNLEQLAKHSANMFVLSGINSVPVANLIDKAMIAHGGTGFLNAALANPHLSRAISGLPGWAWGVNIGTRHNVVNALANMVNNMPSGATGGFLKQSFTAWDNFHKNPTSGTAFVKALKASLPGQMGAVLKGLNDDQIGQILDSRNFPLYTPTPEEAPRIFGLEAIGAKPVEVLEREQARTLAVRERKGAQAEEQGALDDYKRAVLTRDPEAISKAAQAAIKAGATAQSLKDAARAAVTPMEFREIRLTPKRLRKDIVPVMQRLREEQQ
jgi:transglycosylase-like protein with SLT domain